MATVSAKVYGHHRKTDGSYNVKIRVFHRGIKKFIDTQHYVTDRQIGPDGEVKDSFIQSQLDRQLDDYRTTISGLGERLDLFSAEALRDFLRDKDKPIEFIGFCQAVIDERMENGQVGSAKTLKTVRYSLIDYFERETASVMKIHYDMLVDYEKYLRKERAITRPDKYGMPTTRTVKGMENTGLHNHMRDLRTLFNEAVKKYNNKSLGIIRIPHDPFEGYTLPKLLKGKKKKLDRPRVLAIRDCPAETGTRLELTRDLFMLSFYLCGMNAKDFYDLRDENIVDGRLEYNRSKTEGRRDDNAFISIKLVEPAKALLKKYMNVLRDRYSTFENLDHALAEGMKQLSKKLEFEQRVTFYWARHTFADMARNKCKVSKDDVGEALNHSDPDHKVTDIYIDRDWSIIDRVQGRVIRYLETGKWKKARKKKNKNRDSIPVEIEALAREIALKLMNSPLGGHRLGQTETLTKETAS